MKNPRADEKTAPPDSRTLELARALIARPSITPDDAGCQEIIAQRLEALGFSCEFIRRGGVTNLWARRGTARPLFCFAGHTDVVPPGPMEAWTSPPFAPEIRAGHLYGRGAADMKSSLAAMVTAIEAFLVQCPDPSGSLAVLLTSDEEGDAIDGTAAVIETLRSRGETIDACVVGEPTAVNTLGDTLKNGRRGSLSGTLRVLGTQCHIAYPHLGKNPIHLVAPALAELAATSWDAGDALFPPTTWQISNIHGGTGATNIVPGHVDIQFNFRFSPASSPESLQARLTAILDRHALPYTLTWTLGAQSFSTGRGPLAEAAIATIRETCGIEPELSTTGGTSDGRFIATLCPQLIEIGPVNASSHKIDECVQIEALPKLSALYLGILERLIGSRPERPAPMTASTLTPSSTRTTPPAL